MPTTEHETPSLGPRVTDCTGHALHERDGPIQSSQPLCVLHTVVALISHIRSFIRSITKYLSNASYVLGTVCNEQNRESLPPSILVRGKDEEQGT